MGKGPYRVKVHVAELIELSFRKCDFRNEASEETNRVEIQIKLIQVSPVLCVELRIEACNVIKQGPHPLR